LDTCPVGVATQNPELRARFTGQAEHVVNFFRFIAEEVRELLAELGYRTLEEAVGDTSSLDIDEALRHWKAEGLDLSPILSGPKIAADQPRWHAREQVHGLEEHFDHRLVAASQAALERRDSVVIDLPIRNVDRAVGTMLGHEVAKRFGS